MNIDDAITNRRSVRQYKNKKVEDNKLFDILNAGLYAPSSGNIQNTRFIVVTNDDKKKEIAKACLKQDWMIDATLIVVCSDSKKVIDYYGRKGELYSIQNTAAAIENMLLKATSLNLASCWVGAFSDSSVKRILNIPDEIEVHAIITIGYGNEIVEERSLQRLENVTYFEEYGNKRRDFKVLPLRKQINRFKKLVK